MGLAGVVWDDLLSVPELSDPILCKSLSASRERFVHKPALIKRILVIKRLLGAVIEQSPGWRESFDFLG